MIRIAVVDDEKADRTVLLTYIHDYFSQIDERVVTYCFDDGKSLLGQYPEALDLLFLDIKMKHTHGIEAARKIREFDQNVLLIFTTNLTKYVFYGYKVDAFDYMVKPIHYDVFSKCMSRILKKLQQKKTRLVQIRTKKGPTYVNADEILYCETYHKKMLIHTRAMDIPCSESMQSLQEKVIPYNFACCHRSFIINMDYVETISALSVIMKGGAEIPVSKYRKKEFMQILAHYVGGDFN